MPLWNSLLFQDSSSPVMTHMIDFHDYTLLILTFVSILVFVWVMSLLSSTTTNRLFLQQQTIEILWTLTPVLLILLIAMPSLRLLYLTDTSWEPSLTLKVTGSQWYWTYTYPEVPNLSFQTYMTTVSTEGPRLLEGDNRVPLPMEVPLRFLVTATDVIHSWALPSLGLKIDAIPGRLNSLSTLIQRPGLYFGQCSEICGANHSFMPISVESVKPTHFSSLL